MKIEHERGYLILAQNNDDVDYVGCARALANNIRCVEPQAKICLLTDIAIQDPAFDLVRTFPYGDQSKDDQWKLHNDWQCFYASPFRQTIKLEADLLLPRSISHWFDICQHRDVVVTLGGRDYRNKPSTSRHYRRVFDANNLPDTYNAITYWRLSPLAKTFFDTVRDIFQNWDPVMQTLRYGKDQPLNTDLAYAIAVQLLGLDQCTLPGSVPSLIHMKSRFNDLQTEDWTRELIWEFTDSGFRINTIDQMWPVHYHVKSFAKHMEEYYGRRVSQSV